MAELTFELVVVDAVWTTWIPPEDSSSPTCPLDGLTVTFEVSFATADGQFDEIVAFDTFLHPADWGLYVEARLPMDALGGEFTWPGASELALEINVFDDTLTGEVVAISETNGRCGVAAFNADLMTTAC